MAVGSKILLILNDLSTQFLDSKDAELLFKSVSVSADGVSNGLDITESSGAFSFNSKNFVNVGTINGVSVATHASRHIGGGADEVDGDKLDIDWTPTNYTRDNSIGEADNLTDLAAHLKGLDTEIGTIKSIQAGQEWQNSVLDKDLTAPPGSPSTGDRYLLGTSTATSTMTGAWAGHDGEIAEWNGTAWVFTSPTAGMFISADDEQENIYLFDGTNTWQQKKFEATTAGDGLTKSGVEIAALADVTSTSTTIINAINVSSNGIAVVVDDSTLEGSGQGVAGAESLRVKDGGITAAKLAATSVTAAKLGSDVAGSGLAGGNGSALTLKVDITSTTTTEANAAVVGANGLSIKVDDLTIEGSGQGSGGAESLRLKEGGVTEAHINSSAIGSSGRLIGGSGTKLDVKFKETITNGSATVAIASGDIIYQKADGNWELARADVTDLDQKNIGIAAEAIAASGTGEAYVYDGTRLGGFTGLTIGKYVVVSRSVAGGYAQSSSGFVSGETLYSIGRAVSATEVGFIRKVLGVFA